MFRFLDRLRRDEEGQTLVLAAVSMLVLALAVMTTLNIGNAAYERIKLQNTADSAAYSLAAQQARVFNFFAYTNRAMICHYQTALTFMAFLSFAIYWQNTIGRLIQFIPYVGTAIKKVIDAVVKILDFLVIGVVVVVGILNYVYFVFQAVMWIIMQAQLVLEPDVVTENDPDAKTGLNWSNLGGSDIIQAVAKVGNLVMLNKAIDYTQLIKTLPFSSDFKKVVTPAPEGSEARIIMTEMINNARHGWVAGTEEGIPGIGRIWDFEVDILIFSAEFGKHARTEHGMRSGGGNQRHDQIYSVEELFIKLGAEISVAGVGIGMSVTFRYWNIVMADWTKTKGGHLEWGDIETDCPTGTGWACDLVFEKVLGTILDNLGAKMLKDKHHIYFGVTPFMKFAPKPKFREAFNQPDYLIIANKLEDKMTAYYQQKFGIDVGTSGDRIQNSRGEDSKLDFAIDVTNEDSILGSLMPGFNAISIGRAYYHRPGEWKENPNFFNPFWAAKLHPVAHYQGFEMLHFGWIADEVITH